MVLQEGCDVFGFVEAAPADKIFAVKRAYGEDTSPNKVNLGIGAYRDENGKPYVLNVVRQVCIII